MNDFSNDVQRSIENISNCNFGEFITEYNQKLTTVVNKHALLITKEVKVVKNAAWFDNEYRELRKKRRNAEKKFKHTGNPEDQVLFKAMRKETTQLARSKK